MTLRAGPTDSTPFASSRTASAAAVTPEVQGRHERHSMPALNRLPGGSLPSAAGFPAPRSQSLGTLPGEVLRQIAEAREADGTRTLSGVDVVHLTRMNKHLRRELLSSDQVKAGWLTDAATKLAPPHIFRPFDPAAIPTVRPELEAILGGPSDQNGAKTIKNLPPELQVAPLIALINNRSQWPAGVQKVTETWAIRSAVIQLGKLLSGGGQHQLLELRKAAISLYSRPMIELLSSLKPSDFEHFINGDYDKFEAESSPEEHAAFTASVMTDMNFMIDRCKFATPHDLAAKFSSDPVFAELCFNKIKAENPDFELSSLRTDPQVAATLREARTNPDVWAELPPELQAFRPLIQAMQALVL
jgi:hypothetical protein